MNAEEIFDYYKLYDQRFGLPYKDKWKAFTQPKAPNKKLRLAMYLLILKTFYKKVFITNPRPS